MRKHFIYPLLLLAASSLAGCQVIGAIFKAGVWFGILIVVAIIAVIVFIIRGVSKKS